MAALRAKRTGRLLQGATDGLHQLLRERGQDHGAALPHEQFVASAPRQLVEGRRRLRVEDDPQRLHRERGQTVLMVTHDRALAREADRVLLLKDGRLQGENVQPPRTPA